MFETTSTILITTNMHMAPMLAKELTGLGFPVLEERPLAVTTEGTMTDAIRLNKSLFTGHRVLFRVHSFKAHNPEILYKEVKKVEWARWLHSDGYVRLDAAVNHPTIRDKRFAVLKAKDAIVDRMKEEYGMRPDSGHEHKGASVFVYWSEREGGVYIDTTGEALSRRGYRVHPHGAPMQETLAAAVLLHTGWTPPSLLLNPMCGGGTLAIEAALMATRRLPGLLRENYAYQFLKGYDPEMDTRLNKEIAEGIIEPADLEIYASDIHSGAIRATHMNAEKAGVEHLIRYETCDFRDSSVPEESHNGVIVINPEYGEQLGDIDTLRPTYRAIGDWFKKRCQGYTGYVFTGSPELAKAVGLKPEARTPFLNAKIECRLLKYTIYQGKKSSDDETADTEIVPLE